MSLTVYLKYYHKDQRRYYRRKLAGPTPTNTINLGVLKWPEKALWGNLVFVHDGKSAWNVNARTPLNHPLMSPEQKISE